MKKKGSSARSKKKGRRGPQGPGEGELARITFYGASQEVTGSKFLLETRHSRVLVDCGMFQGDRKDRTRNAARFPFSPESLDAVLLTHAHIDHSGLLPKLVRDGYGGPIYTTTGTVDLCKIMLPDSAHIHEQDAKYKNRLARRRGKKLEEPLYVTADAERALSRFEGFPFGQRVPVTEDVSCRFRLAGHILGASSVEVWVKDGGLERKIVFSGDIGRTIDPLLRDPDPPEQADLVLMESTYGDRDHRGNQETLDEFVEILNESQRTGGNVIVPVFAVNRAQEILYHLACFEREGRIKPRRVFLDSPMAISVTRLYKRNADCVNLESCDDPDDLPNYLQPKDVAFTRTPEQSMAINHQRGVVILAASGMCEGGRVMHHLKHNLWREETRVAIVGFQARGTLGRRLVEGADKVRIYGEEIAVRARIDTLGGFSAHAGQSELVEWFAGMRSPHGEGAGGGRPDLVLIHGEQDRQEILAERVQRKTGVRAHIPAVGDQISLPRSGPVVTPLFAERKTEELSATRR